MENNIFEQDEKMMDDLLIILNEYLEDRGKSPEVVSFDLSHGDDNFFEKHPVSMDKFLKILKKCKSRGYIRYGALGSGFRFMNLTESGREKALQAIFKVTRNNREINHMRIDNITVNGNAQIGDNNVQNINAITHQVLSQIENSNISAAEKEEAKSLWQKVCENNLICSILGGIASTFPFK